jgi:hypothetical protein
MNHETFAALALANPVNRAILARLPLLGTPDTWLVSGALFQTVWNVRTDRDPTYGIRDYDIFYFDPDTSYDAEDRAIARARELFSGVGGQVELRNQARVHLWYAQKFGMPYPPLLRATDGIDRFLMPCAQIGMRPDGIGGWDVYAPKGFDDIWKLTVRPNRTANFSAERYDEKAQRWKTLWPELTVHASQPCDLTGN